MGNNVSVQEKVYKCAKGNDAVQLQGIIRQLVSAAADVKTFIEYQDTTGHTPLTIACKGGNYECVDLLLRHGANLHHFTRWPEGSTALHEAVNRSNLRCAELLMQYGANPFVENARGLTCVDAAINRGHVAMIRSLELRSDFTGTLQMKVSKYMGLGAEWKQRWVVVMPRYQAPHPSSPGQQHVARLLLVCYKARDQCDPCCKVWLDGAVARSVTGSLGSGFLQCALSLHQSHAMASGALMTGDQSSGYTLHLRPPDGSATGAQALRHFMEIVNGPRSTHVPQQSQQQPPPTPERPGPSRQSSRTSYAPSHSHTASDEEMARILQAQYDAEYSSSSNARAKQPPSPIRGSSGSRLNPNYPAVGASTSSPLSPPQGLDTCPSAPNLYPNIDLASSYANGTTGAQGGPDSNAWTWSGGSATGSPAHPTSAQPLATEAPNGRPATTPSPAPVANGMSSGQRVNDDDEAGNCVICMNAPATAGFLHGESVHKCCCKDCAKGFKEARATCPMCRMPIEHVILNFY